MKRQAYIKDGELCVNFNHATFIYSQMQFLLGNAVTRFSMLPESWYREVLEKIQSEFMLSIQNKETDEQLFGTLKFLVQEISEVEPYFNFYMETCVAFLLCLRRQEKEILKVLRNFLLKQGDDIDMDAIDFSNLTATSKWVVEILSEDIKKRQKLLKEDLDAITGSAKDFAGLTPMQRLYLLSKLGRNYLSGEFKTTLAPNYTPMPDDLDKIKSTLRDNKVDIVEMVEINNLDDLLSFEMYHTLKADLKIKKCKYCGEYFVVRGRVDIEYCDRIKEGETKPCSMIGAIRGYWRAKESDPIHSAFQKAYKRNHSRQRVGKMTQNEFYEWSETARRKRTECETGKLSLDDFNVWLGNKA